MKKTIVKKSPNKPLINQDKLGKTLASSLLTEVQHYK